MSATGSGGRGSSAGGPSGRAASPPAWLASADLPLDTIAAGTPLHRVHRVTHGPVFFGPGHATPPTYRFDSPTAAFGVLYVGRSLNGALVETLLRNPSRRLVAYAEIAARASSTLRSSRELKLVRLHGTGLQQVGCDNAISTGPYEPCGEWADALWAHPSLPDGVAYQSRHDSSEICVALFERADLGLAAQASTRLQDQLPMIANLLGLYGKSIDPPP